MCVCISLGMIGRIRVRMWVFAYKQQELYYILVSLYNYRLSINTWDRALSVVKMSEAFL